MKPPSRRRAGPSRFKQEDGEERRTGRCRDVCKNWSRKDQHNFLKALKRQQNFESEIDLTALKKEVPSRSLQEVEEVIETLKTRVAQKVHQQVQAQRREERLNKVPIEIWGELVEKVSGSHEKTVSSAFKQMLLVAAVEPENLLHSIPPQAITFQSPAGSSHPVPIILKPNVLAQPSLQSIAPKVTVLPKQTENESSSTDATSKTSVSTSLAADSPVHANSVSSAVEHASKLQLDEETSSSVPDSSTPTAPTPEPSQVIRSPVQQESEPQATVSGLFTGSESPSGSLTSKRADPESERSEPDSSHIRKAQKCVVNFNSIYEYIADSDSRACATALTPMECAVMLDLLMCLPEELPLLDCKALQHHLLQVHTQLSQPVKSPASVPDTGTNIPCANETDSAAFTSQPETSAGSSQLPEGSSGDAPATEPAVDEEDWSSVGTRPLNPLLIPLALLNRRSLDSDK